MIWMEYGEIKAYRDIGPKFQDRNIKRGNQQRNTCKMVCFHRPVKLRNYNQVIYLMILLEDRMSLLDCRVGFVTGMVLGDGYLSKWQQYLSVRHTTKQYQYMKIKLELAEFFGYKIWYHKTKFSNSSLGMFEYCGFSLSGLDIAYYYNRSLIDRINDLDRLGLLIWWLDDGSLSVHTKKNGYVGRHGYLNTQRHGYDGNVLLSNLLYQKFGLETKINIDTKSGVLQKKDHYRLYFNAVNMRLLIDIVRPYIHLIPSSMLYKLNMKYTINHLPESPILVNCYNF